MRSFLARSVEYDEIGAVSSFEAVKLEPVSTGGSTLLEIRYIAIFDAFAIHAGMKAMSRTHSTSGGGAPVRCYPAI